MHTAVNILYTGFGNLQVTLEMLTELLKHEHLIDVALDKAFAEILFGNQRGDESRKVEGYNLIVRQVIRHYMPVGGGYEGGSLLYKKPRREVCCAGTPND
jgi:hypothetical protein